MENRIDVGLLVEDGSKVPYALTSDGPSDEEIIVSYALSPNESPGLVKFLKSVDTKVHSMIEADKKKAQVSKCRELSAIEKCGKILFAEPVCVKSSNPLFDFKSTNPIFESSSSSSPTLSQSMLNLSPKTDFQVNSESLQFGDKTRLTPSISSQLNHSLSNSKSLNLQCVIPISESGVSAPLPSKPRRLKELARKFVVQASHTVREKIESEFANRKRMRTEESSSQSTINNFKSEGRAMKRRKDMEKLLVEIDTEGSKGGGDPKGVTEKLEKELQSSDTDLQSLKEIKLVGTCVADSVQRKVDLMVNENDGGVFVGSGSNSTGGFAAAVPNQQPPLL
ncbi:hypothetical protein AQUCO_05000056v1 [Aquilegia coerulea]|uniref:Uncharacterized protein n=1 Tax=Aquilegia coerulea TaxID=218851 RepID=A0A2G5CJB0_AQUCA|nr:hypothetical protein AQUCO_05000056v1 [Aquilegia coerulea]